MPTSALERLLGECPTEQAGAEGQRGGPLFHSFIPNQTVAHTDLGRLGNEIPRIQLQFCPYLQGPSVGNLPFLPGLEHRKPERREEVN